MSIVVDKLLPVFTLKQYVDKSLVDSVGARRNLNRYIKTGKLIKVVNEGNLEVYARQDFVNKIAIRMLKPHLIEKYANVATTKQETVVN